jgi:hypothetical protein
MLDSVKRPGWPIRKQAESGCQDVEVEAEVGFQFFFERSKGLTQIIKPLKKLFYIFTAKTQQGQ